MERKFKTSIPDWFKTTSVPDWIGRVDQANLSAVARFISSFPNVKTLTMDEQSDFVTTAVERAFFFGLTVKLDRRGFAVDRISEGSELYYTIGGTHATYGNFATFWSVRGRGDGPPARPLFLFWDGEAEFLKSAEAA